MARFSDVTWPQIEALRGEISAMSADSLAAGAQRFVELFSAAFPSIVLARLFAVVPFDRLPDQDREWASAFVARDARLSTATRVLSLLGSAGRRSEWNDRARSTGHLAIPLLDRAFVQGIPMITKLLSDLQIDLRALDDGTPIATRSMLGGKNSTFFVEDASSARDPLGRPIIPARDFVAEHRIRTVFGMGGAYIDGTLAIAIFFCEEAIEQLTVDRFPSFISTFKMVTSRLVREGSLYGAVASP